MSDPRDRKVKKMKRTLHTFVCALFTLTILSAAGTADEKPLRIAFIAYQNPDQLIEDVRPVVAYLEEALQVSVKHFAATDYAGIVEALRNETADVGFMGPLQYVLAHQQAGAYPILGEIYNGSPTYVSRIFVRKDSDIEKIEDLRNKTIAFVDPISSSGYMYPLGIFRKAGLVGNKEDGQNFFKKIYFAGGDEQAIRAVLNSFVDAAGIGQYSYNLLRPEERDAIKFIAESEKIPSHCVVVRKDLDKKTTSRLQEALLALNDGPRKSLLKHLYNVDGYVKVTHETYLQVEHVARDYGYLRTQ